MRKRDGVAVGKFATSSALPATLAHRAVVRGATGKTDGTDTGSKPFLLATFERSLMAQRLRPRDALRKAANPASPYRRSASEEREGVEERQHGGTGSDRERLAGRDSEPRR